jgi:SAM-dependent methyltransferase
MRDTRPTEQPTTAPSGGDDVPMHLGGHYNYTNMEGEVFGYLVHRYKIKKMLDVGCGMGGMVDFANDFGIRAIGVDGDPYMKRDTIFVHDFMSGAFRNRHKKFDLIWCVEFLEHIDRAYLPYVLETFLKGRVLFITFAIPEQGGHHHVNLQNEDYWIGVLCNDWTLDTEATHWIRTYSKNEPYIKKTGMVWIKN